MQKTYQLHINQSKSESLADSECLVRDILKIANITPKELAHYLGASLVSVIRCQRGDTQPDPSMQAKLNEIVLHLQRGHTFDLNELTTSNIFASRGAPRSVNSPKLKHIAFHSNPLPPILSRLCSGEFWGNTPSALTEVLAHHNEPAPTIDRTAAEGISAGKNTYTYDAHTYHTKVPPQGIAEVLKQYLPNGGLVFDPFAGSGMTGVAALAMGNDVILNDLSPAACFIADRFTKTCDPTTFSAGVQAVCAALSHLRRKLYTTRCRTCGKNTEILYTVWSYRVCCSSCGHEFLLWDHCRRYGKTVREHKILAEFPCPHCDKTIKKSRLSRTTTEPVLLGYKCCSKLQVEHPLNDQDRACIRLIEASPPIAEGFIPDTPLPDGVNLSQPKRHGLTSVDSFYTRRNLAAMSSLWREIHRLKDKDLAGFLAFVFTSLYQRVTRLSEYRFWGGSGNTANFNVPYIFNEANVFLTFERKANTIQDHLQTTARSYKGRAVVHTGSATNLSFLPDNSIDFVFTDPPFGANINYSEMNILWESWLGVFTDATDEAIINRVQHKDVACYGNLMTKSLCEVYRVLRSGHWMVLAFMNSSQEIWHALHQAVLTAGFSLERIDSFDKQHGTFKQFVSDNTAGCDLLLHCRKPSLPVYQAIEPITIGKKDPVRSFLSNREGSIPRLPYLHVQRKEEIDYRKLYSEFLATNLMSNGNIIDFAEFRNVASLILEE